jgi:hypothetical protein
MIAGMKGEYFCCTRSGGEQWGQSNRFVFLKSPIVADRNDAAPPSTPSYAPAWQLRNRTCRISNKCRRPIAIYRINYPPSEFSHGLLQ